MRILLVTPDAGLPPEIDRALREAVAEAKHEMLADPPPARPGLAAGERARFLATIDRMMEADMLLVDASDPDGSVAWCVAWMLARGRLVVMTCRHDTRAGLASMLAGNPSPWQRTLVYAAAEELRAALVRTLKT